MKERIAADLMNSKITMIKDLNISLSVLTTCWQELDKTLMALEDSIDIDNLCLDSAHSKKKKKSNLVTSREWKILYCTKLQGSISVKNRTKNHESNTKITARSVESSRRALYLIQLYISIGNRGSGLLSVTSHYQYSLCLCHTVTSEG